MSLPKSWTRQSASPKLEVRWTVLDQPCLLQPEYMRNVQQSSKEVFLRTAEASQCRVHSVLVLPLFADAGRRGALGVLELITTAEDMPFDSIVSTVDGILQVRGVE